MASGGPDSSGTTLMDLITADPSSAAGVPAASQAPPSALGKPVAPGERKSKRGALAQIQNDTISVAKAALNPVRTNIIPQKQKKKVLERGFLDCLFSFSVFFFLAAAVLGCGSISVFAKFRVF